MHTQQQELADKALKLKGEAQGGGEQVTTTLTGVRQVRASRKAKRRAGARAPLPPRPDQWRDRETVSIDEASIILGVGRASAYAAAHSGALPGLWFGKRFLVSVPRLKRMIDGE